MNRRQLLRSTAFGAALVGIPRLGYAQEPGTLTPVWGYEIVAEYPHDPTAYTQGLVYIGDGFFEGTGLRGESDLRETVLASGEVLRQTPLADDYFGEGIALVDDRIYQITWQEETAFLYDRVSFERIGEFSYDGEGWGLTWNGEHLVMSNGSATIAFRNLDDFSIEREIVVRDGDLEIARLNELEWIDGEIWANVYQTDWIVRIDPETGDVTGWIDLRGILPLGPGEGEPGVLNGIAWDEESGRLFITGKFWPLLFEITLTGPA